MVRVELMYSTLLNNVNYTHKFFAVYHLYNTFLDLFYECFLWEKNICD